MGDAAGEWMPLLSGERVAPGQIVAVDVGGTELVVWRDHLGRPCVMDARCPHQWSHLGAEGVVDGDEVVCAAHFWRFNRDGHGTKVNVKGRRDEKADIAVFPCAERDGQIHARVPLPDGSGG
jgi:phenylpropionate dioxygenase-like ring-hydroxylating dioxygenase large terminal subunit